ncbi:hypothetical protein BDR07DRAFT_363753 [Suillus spraguei]|nr:hypothetical protein BDR07DRAFT_363753 [Suillus spraguei]
MNIYNKPFDGIILINSGGLHLSSVKQVSFCQIISSESMEIHAGIISHSRQRYEASGTPRTLILSIYLGPQASHLKNLLNNQKCVKPLLRYIASTHRLEQIFGDVTPPADDKEEE